MNTSPVSSMLGPIERLVAARTGLSFSGARLLYLEAAITRAMVRTGVGSFAELAATLEADRAEFDRFVAELIVGETHFFRHAEQLDYLRRVVLPGLAALRGPSRALRLWSAGCSSGEEPYTLAIILREIGLDARASVLGTDLCDASLARARAGRYRDWSLRGIDAAALNRYFDLDTESGEKVLREEIRALVRFERLNLVEDVYPSARTGTSECDLIVCRNVLIYFSPETVRAVGARLLASLAEQGWLVTGPSDPPLTVEPPFAAVVTPAGVLYRRDAASAHVDAPVTGACSSEVAPLSLAAQYEERRSNVEESERDEHDDGVIETVHVIAREQGSIAALHAVERAALQRPLVAGLHLLRGVLLADLGRTSEAVDALRRAIYLDRTLAIAHFFLGALLARLGDIAGARRAYRNAHALSARMPADALLPLAEGERAGRLAAAALQQLARLGA